MAENEKKEQPEPKQQVFPLNTVRLCIDTYEKDIKGRVYSKLYDVEARFNSCSEMIMCIERLYDACGYTQNFQEKRSFSEQKEQLRRRPVPKARRTDEELCKQKGEYRTFNLIVWSRMSAGWQGKLLRHDGTMAGSFTSEMELLGCICRELRI